MWSATIRPCNEPEGLEGEESFQELETFAVPCTPLNRWLDGKMVGGEPIFRDEDNSLRD